MTRRPLKAIVTCTVALALTPSAAAAGQLSYGTDPASGEYQLSYQAAAGEANNLSIMRREPYSGVPENFYVVESWSPLTWTPPCEHESFGVQPAAWCPTQDVARVLLELGDGDDYAIGGDFGELRVPAIMHGGEGNDALQIYGFRVGNVVDGGPGADTIKGGGASDDLIGGEGNDTIDAATDSLASRTDHVSCGPGNDTVRADPDDEIADDCEHVQYGADSGGPGGPSGPNPPAPPMARSDGRPIGVSIDGGAAFTDTPDVSLTVLPPDAATDLLVSNDGGFASARRLRVDRRTNTYDWQLSQTRTERLPKIVYVRFIGEGIDPTATVTDDVILDQTAPSAVAARLARIRSRACAAKRRACIRVSLSARDSGSGVARVQFARNKRRPSKPVKFRRSLRLTSVPRWVRVDDAAGNFSRWRRVNGARL